VSVASDAMPGRLRLALYGHLNQHLGSSSGSHYLLLRQLLQSGHLVTLYAIEGFVSPQDLKPYRNLRFCPIKIRWIDEILLAGMRVLPRAVSWLYGWMVNTFRMQLYYRAIANRIESEHRNHPYDALLVVDLANPFRKIRGLRCLNWTQGSSYGELEAVWSQRRNLGRYTSRFFVVALVVYYRIRISLSRRLVRTTKQLICCSQWTKRAWTATGYPAERIAVIPFALNLDLFHPVLANAAAAPEARSSSGPTLLHLGRIVPRKRLDLLIEAFRLVLECEAGARLIVIGRFAYAERYRELLDPAHCPPRVEYRECISREDVPALMAAVDVVVQTSENEDFGSTVMEALGCGVPAVVGPTNGTGEYRGAGVYLFDSYEPQAVANSILLAWNDVRTKDPVAHKTSIRQTAEQYFSPSVIADRITNLIHATCRVAPQATHD
jgi:glycosyltransferase involved in cell wall biosynthesis